MVNNLIKIEYGTCSEEDLKRIKNDLRDKYEYCAIREKIKETYKEEFKENYIKVFEYIINNKTLDNYLRLNVDKGINVMVKPIFKILNVVNKEFELRNKYFIKYNNNFFLFETDNLLNKIKYINDISEYKNKNFYYVNIENILDYLNE